MHKDELVKFWKLSTSGSGSRSFFRVLFNMAKYGILPQCGSYLWTNLSNLRENFTTIITLNKGIPIKFWKSSGSEVRIPSPDFGYGLQMWIRFTLLSASALVKDVSDSSCHCLLVNDDDDDFIEVAKIFLQLSG